MFKYHNSPSFEYIIILDPMEHYGGVLRYASKVSDFSIVNFLIQKYLEKHKSQNDLDDLSKYINFPDTKGKTALHYACQKKCLKTLEILLKHRGGKLFD